MQSTKQRIIISAEKLFLQFGIANVRLQQIADETGISVGNLAYHFSNKDAIVIALYHDVVEELSKMLVTSKIQPGFASFDEKFSRLYKFIRENVFYFSNFWEIKRNFPQVNRKMQQLNDKIYSKLKKRIIINVHTDLIEKEEYKGSHDLLAKALLLSINTWMPQQLLNNKSTAEPNFKKFLWGQVYPFMTSKGKSEFSRLISYVFYLLFFIP